MAIIVWGAKVKLEQSGSLAMDCPVCLERTVGDQLVLLSARHIYFIHGGYKEAARYARCRLCGMAAPRPDDAIGMFDIPPDMFTANPDLIARSNPSLAEKPKRLPDVFIEYPAGVTRVQAALFGAILECANAQGKDDKVTGFTGGLALLLLPLAVFVSSYADNPVPPLAATFIIGAAFILNLHLWMIHRAVAREMSPYVRRVLQHTNLTIDNLIENSAKLGKRYLKVSGHLQRCRMSYT